MERKLAQRAATAALAGDLGAVRAAVAQDAAVSHHWSVLMNACFGGKVSYGNLGSLYEPGGVKVLPAFKLRDQAGARIERNYRVIERVIAERGDWRRLLPDQAALDRLIFYSGGHLRDLLRLVGGVLTLAQSIPVPATTVDVAIDQLRTEFLPIADDEAIWLEEISRTHRIALSSSDRLPVLARFLDTHLALCYLNGDEWYDIHPLIADHVNTLSESARTEAATAFQEALDLRRRTAEMDQTSGILRDLAVSLDHVGFVQRLGGEFAPSLATHEESLALRRRLLAIHGETPEALRHLSSSLNSVGQLRQQTGDLAVSLAAYNESVTIARRLLKEIGTTPETLRDLSISLGNVGMGQRAAGSLSDSVAAYEESVSLRRRRIEEFGETPQGVADLATSLSDLSGVLRSTNRERALAVMEDSLASFRRLSEVLGETPYTMGELANRLGAVADLRREEKDPAGAAAAGDEAETIRQRLHSIGAGSAE